MKALDHDTFHAMEIDALYEELDGPSASAIQEHAASCESCASRFQRLRRARQRGLAVLAEAVPDDFESRVMAAVDAALAKDAPAAPRSPAAAGAGAKVIPLFARPSFAVAATFVLVLGAAAILSQMGMAKKAAPMASSEEAPAAVAASAFAAAPAATMMAPPPVVAAADEPDLSGVAAQGAKAPRAVVAHAAPPPPAAAPAAKPSMRTEADDSKPAKAAMGRAGPAVSPAFASAKTLYDAGRYAEALPRFDALKASDPEAELYAARCVQKLRGCTAAAPRFDALAQRSSGTELGNRASVEAAACRPPVGQAQAAPATTSTTSPGTPGGGRPATPKTTAPAEATPTDDTRR